MGTEHFVSETKGTEGDRAGDTKAQEGPFATTSPAISVSVASCLLFRP